MYMNEIQHINVEHNTSHHNNYDYHTLSPTLYGKGKYLNMV